MLIVIETCCMLWALTCLLFQSIFVLLFRIRTYSCMSKTDHCTFKTVVLDTVNITVKAQNVVGSAESDIVRIDTFSICKYVLCGESWLDTCFQVSYLSDYLCKKSASRIRDVSSISAWPWRDQTGKQVFWLHHLVISFILLTFFVIETLQNVCNGSRSISLQY